MTSTFSIFMIALTVMIYAAVPITTAFLLRRKRKLSYVPFLIGIGTGLLGTWLSNILNRVLWNLFCAKAPVDIETAAFAAVSTLCIVSAGIVFIEIPRILVIKVSMKRYIDEPLNALMFGAGFGGAYLNMGGLPSLIDQLIYVSRAGSETQAFTLDAFIYQMTTQVNTPPESLLTILTFLFAFALQIALCVIAWHACRDHRRFLYPVTIAVYYLYTLPGIIATDDPKLGAVLLYGTIAVIYLCVYAIALKSAPEVKTLLGRQRPAVIEEGTSECDSGNP